MVRDLRKALVEIITGLMLASMTSKSLMWLIPFFWNVVPTGSSESVAKQCTTDDVVIPDVGHVIVYMV